MSALWFPLLFTITGQGIASSSGSRSVIRLLEDEEAGPRIQMALVAAMLIDGSFGILDQPEWMERLKMLLLTTAAAHPTTSGSDDDFHGRTKITDESEQKKVEALCGDLLSMYSSGRVFLSDAQRKTMEDTKTWRFLEHPFRDCNEGEADGCEEGDAKRGVGGNDSFRLPIAKTAIYGDSCWDSGRDLSQSLQGKVVNGRL